jgi:hypothetical protein
MMRKTLVSPTRQLLRVRTPEPGPPDGVLRRGRQHCGRTEPNPPPASRPSFALLVLVTGVLITAIDATIVIVALPEIKRAIHIRLTSVIWVIIGYVLVITLVLTQVGRLGDMFGRVGMYSACTKRASWSSSSDPGRSTMWAQHKLEVRPCTRSSGLGWNPPKRVGVPSSDTLQAHVSGHLIAPDVCQPDGWPW